MKSIKLITFVAVVLCCVTTSHAATFTPLGDLPSGSFFSQANGISADGSVIVGHSQVFVTDSVKIDPLPGTGMFTNQAFRWTADGGMVALGDLPDGIFKSSATGVSADGSVIVGVGNGLGEVDLAFRWTTGSGMVSLGGLPGSVFSSGTPHSVANDVSSDGTIIVGKSLNAAGKTEAFRWTSGGMTGLGDLFGDTFRSSANAISGNGLVIVGGSDSSDSETQPSVGSFDEAFRWTTGGGMEPLGIVGPVASIASCACAGSDANGVSANGSVIVGWSSDAPPSIFPFHSASDWNSADGIAILDGLYSVTTASSIANDTSADGSVVVGKFGPSVSLVIEPATVTDAFIWNQVDGFKNLQSLLFSEYGIDLPGWTLQSATAISDDGSVITGFGQNPAGNTEAWVIDLNAVPEPSTLLLCTLAILGLLMCKIKFRLRSVFPATF